MAAYFSVTLTMDNQKTESVVESYKFFDMIGDLGGFLEGLLLLFSVLASPISAKFYEYTIAEQNYKRVNSDFKFNRKKDKVMVQAEMTGLN